MSVVLIVNLSIKHGATKTPKPQLYAKYEWGKIHLNAIWTVEKILSFWSRFRADSGDDWRLWNHQKWFAPHFPCFGSRWSLSSSFTWIPRFHRMSGGVPAPSHARWTSQPLPKSRRSPLAKISRLRFRQTPDQSEGVLSTNSHPSADHGGGHSAFTVVTDLRVVTLCVFLKLVGEVVWLSVNLSYRNSLKCEAAWLCLNPSFEEVKSLESRDSPDPGG